MAEKEKMLDGQMYDRFDPTLLQERQRARVLMSELNQLTDNNARKAVIKRLFAAS